MLETGEREKKNFIFISSSSSILYTTIRYTYAHSMMTMMLVVMLKLKVFRVCEKFVCSFLCFAANFCLTRIPESRDELSVDATPFILDKCRYLETEHIDIPSEQRISGL